jgi:hypothetical protein
LVCLPVAPVPPLLLDRSDVAFDHAIRLRVQGCGAVLAHSQALQRESKSLCSFRGTQAAGVGN